MLNPSASSSPFKSRLANITNHMAASPSTVFSADNVPQAPEDPMFGLMAAYRKDSFDKKVDLGIGAYRDDNAKPWVLPVVKQVRYCSLPANCAAQRISHASGLPPLRPRGDYAETPTSTMNTFPLLVLQSSRWRRRS